MDNLITLTPNTECTPKDLLFLGAIYNLIFQNEDQTFGNFCLEFNRMTSTAEHTDLYRIEYLNDCIEIWKHEDHDKQQAGEPPFIRIR